MSTSNAIDTETARAWVLAIVSSIPPGQVRSYGDIAQLVYGNAECGLAVGRFISSAFQEGHDFPWHRVVSTDGRVRALAPREQRTRLEGEGVVFDRVGRARSRRVELGHSQGR